MGRLLATRAFSGPRLDARDPGWRARSGVRRGTVRPASKQASVYANEAGDVRKPRGSDMGHRIRTVPRGAVLRSPSRTTMRDSSPSACSARISSFICVKILACFAACRSVAREQHRVARRSSISSNAAENPPPPGQVESRIARPAVIRPHAATSDHPRETIRAARWPPPRSRHMAPRPDRTEHPPLRQ
jgi:hypothetical protein